MPPLAPKEECLTFLRRLFDAVPDYAIPPTRDNLLKSIARICKLCETEQSHIFKVMLPTPCLVVILSGSKAVSLPSANVVANEGDFLLLPSGVEMDMANAPNPKEGIFRSVVIEFEPKTLRKFSATTLPHRRFSPRRRICTKPRHSCT